MSVIEQNIIKDSIKLKPQNRHLVAEKIIESLSVPNENLNQLWIEESISRLERYKKGQLETLSYAQVFDK